MTATAPICVLTVTRAAAANGTYLIRDTFPLPSTPAFVAQPDGLPEPALLLAVARQESLFNPDSAQSRPVLWGSCS